MTALTFNKETKEYKLAVPGNECILCSACNKRIEYGQNVFIFRLYDRYLGFKKLFLCSRACYDGKKNNAYEQQELISATITDTLKQDAKIITDHPTELKASSISVFQASALESETTKDNTKYASGESLIGATIGDRKYLDKDAKADIKKRLENKRGK